MQSLVLERNRVPNFLRVIEWSNDPHECVFLVWCGVVWCSVDVDVDVPSNIVTDFLIRQTGSCSSSTQPIQLES
jgi:hypothetical protein